MDETINVLLTAVGCPGGPSIIQSLREDSSIRIVGTDMREDVPSKFLVDNFYVIPPGKSEGFIDSILGIVKREKIDVILPLATFELNNLSLHKNLFQREGCEVCISDAEALEIANNRYLLYKKFKNESFIPNFETPINWEDMQNKMKKLDFPNKRVVVKPFVSHGSIGLRIVDNNIDLYDRYLNHKPNSIFISPIILEQIFKNREFNNILLTEYLPGNEYGVDLLLDPITHKVIKGIVRDNGGVTLSSVDKAIIIEHSEILKVCKYIAEELKLSYSINIDVKLDENGKPKIIEINPRLPATSFLATSAGFNLSLFSIYLAVGKKFNIPDFKKGLKIYTYRGFLVLDNEKVIINRC